LLVITNNERAHLGRRRLVPRPPVNVLIKRKKLIMRRRENDNARLKCTPPFTFLNRSGGAKKIVGAEGV